MNIRSHASTPSEALPPSQSRAPRSRAEIERALHEGLRCASSREEATAIATELQLEVLLDVRDLLGECAWRLSDLSSPP